MLLISPAHWPPSTEGAAVERPGINITGLMLPLATTVIRLIGSMRNIALIAAISTFLAVLPFCHRTTTTIHETAMIGAVSRKDVASKPRLANPTLTKATGRNNSVEAVEFPSIGKVNVATRPGSVTWTDSDGKRGVLPFKFQYAPNGVWVRAVYRGPGEDPPETSPEELVELYGMGGEEVKDVPSEPLTPELFPLCLMSRAHEQVAF